VSCFEKYVTYKKETILVVSVLATAAVVVTLASLFTPTRGSLQITSDTFIAQKTATSKARTLPIHQTIQVVTVLPPITWKSLDKYYNMDIKQAS
jgi:hypothetical protein